MDAYVPPGYSIQEDDKDILAQLQKDNIDPEWWLRIWSDLGLTSASDVKMSSDVEPFWTNVDLDSRTRLFALLGSVQGCPRCVPMPPYICPKGKDHCPKDPWRRKHIKEWFSNAAWHGCLPCMRRCVEEAAARDCRETIL